MKCSYISSIIFYLACTAERFFRIDRAQEHLHFVVDICTDDLFILDSVDHLNEEKDDTDITSINTTSSLFESMSSHRKSSVASTISAIQSIQSIQSTNSNSSNSTPTNGSNELKTEQKYNEEPLISTTTLSASNDNININVNDDEAMMKTIYKSISPINTPTQFSHDEVLQSAKHGDLSLLKQLHHKGVSLLAIDEQGMTALHHAARYGYENIVGFLISAAPSTILDLSDNEYGHTALHKAALHRRHNICSMLASRGASLTKLDHQGLTPKQLALKAGDEELANYLQRKLI